MNNIVYEINDSLYINATNRCSNSCEFCVRNNKDFVYGDLWLDEEPTPKDVIKRLEGYNLKNYKEVVFCGYGEPTYRMDVIEKVAQFAHKHGLQTRINTNGHANRINEKDVTPIIVKSIDTIGISLNDVNHDAYNDICHPIYDDGFEEMLDFAKKCISLGGNVVFSVVDCIGKKKIEEAKKIAKDLGAKIRIREEIK